MCTKKELSWIFFLSLKKNAKWTSLTRQISCNPGHLQFSASSMQISGRRFTKKIFTRWKRGHFSLWDFCFDIVSVHRSLCISIFFNVFFSIDKGKLAGIFQKCLFFSLLGYLCLKLTTAYWIYAITSWNQL